jgi:hypothetical protein
MKDKDTQKRLGDCYKASFNLFLEMTSDSDALLVQGEATGQGAIKGVLFGHAWVESRGLVFDRSNGRDIIIPQSVYYAIGHINRVKKYNKAQVCKMIKKYGTYGPWELKTKL